MQTCLLMRAALTLISALVCCSHLKVVRASFPVGFNRSTLLAKHAEISFARFNEILAVFCSICIPQDSNASCDISGVPSFLADTKAYAKVSRGVKSGIPLAQFTRHELECYREVRKKILLLFSGRKRGSRFVVAIDEFWRGIVLTQSLNC